MQQHPKCRCVNGYFSIFFQHFHPVAAPLSSLISAYSATQLQERGEQSHSHFYGPSDHSYQLCFDSTNFRKSMLRRNVQLPSHAPLEGNELCSLGKGKLLWKSRPNPSFSIPPPVSPLNIFKTKQKEGGELKGTVGQNFYPCV